MSQKDSLDIHQHQCLSNSQSVSQSGQSFNTPDCSQSQSHSHSQCQCLLQTSISYSVYAIHSCVRIRVRVWVWVWVVPARDSVAI